jgi:hypothetical protein
MQQIKHIKMLNAPMLVHVIVKAELVVVFQALQAQLVKEVRLKFFIIILID